MTFNFMKHFLNKMGININFNKEYYLSDNNQIIFYKNDVEIKTENLKGNIIELYFKTLKYFNDLYLLNDAVLETFNNAICHQIYSEESRIFIRIYSNKLEILSSGGIEKNLSFHAIENGVFVIRNKKLMKIFEELGFINNCGMGLATIKYFYENKDLLPTFQITNEYFRVILPFTEDFKISNDKQIENSKKINYMLNIINEIKLDVEIGKTVSNKVVINDMRFDIQ